MSEIKEKVENELKTVKALCETMEHAIKTELDKGLDKVNTHEMYEAVDIFKDLSEVKKNIIEGCYKMQIMEAMEESEYGEDYDENGEIRYYRGQPRSKTSGRFMSRGDGRRNYRMTPEMYREYEPEYYRDLDRESMKRMYSTSSTDTSRSYTDGYNDGQDIGYKKGYEEGKRTMPRDYREGRSGRNRRTYIETKETKDNSPESKQMKMRELEKYMNELSSDITEMIGDASPEEKNLLKNKLQTLSQKF